MDGKSVYPNNCCTLRIDFSKMLSVNVRYNNEKSRDFTNPNLPSSDNTNGLPSLPTAAGPTAAATRLPVPTAAAARALIRPAGLEASAAAHLQSMGLGMSFATKCDILSSSHLVSIVDIVTFTALLLLI